MPRDTGWHHMLFDPLDAVLGRRSNIRLLRVLVALERPVSGREAARLARLSHRVIGALDELADVGVLRREEAAGQNLYTFDREYSLAPAITALFAAERERTARMFQRLAEMVNHAGVAVAAAAVFGSAARGEARPDSDLDLLVVTAEEDTKEAVHEAILDLLPPFESAFGERVSVVVISLAQARARHRDGDPFIANVLRDARRVAGEPLEEALKRNPGSGVAGGRCVCTGPEIDALLRELRAGLTTLYGDRLRGVYLYGSYARGEATADSDLDVLIVLDAVASSWQEIKRTSRLRADLSLAYGLPISLVYVGEAEWTEGDRPLIAAVRSEGRAA